MLGMVDNEEEGKEYSLQMGKELRNRLWLTGFLFAGQELWRCEEEETRSGDFVKLPPRCRDIWT